MKDERSDQTKTELPKEYVCIAPDEQVLVQAHVNLCLRCQEILNICPAVDSPSFRTTKEAMEYAQSNNLAAAVPVSVAEQHDYVAWCRYVDDGNTIAQCDSDAEDAFKVYRVPVGKPAPAVAEDARELVEQWWKSMPRGLIGKVTYSQWDDLAQRITTFANQCAEQMRAACVEKVRDLRHKSEPDDSRWNVALYHAEKQIESLTLDRVQEKNQCPKN